MERPADIHFDGWTLQRASGELVNGTRRFRLQDQPLQILEALLASPGQVVTREQLIARLWPKGIVDFDTGLNSAVRKLRSALGDEADTPRYIETLPRKGYRFIGTLTPPADSAPPPATTSQPAEPGAPPAWHTEGRPVAGGYRWIVIAVVAACVGLAVVLLTPFLRHASSEASSNSTTATSRATSPLGTHSPAAESLAVLPFKPLLPATANAALELGMADTLITQLSNLPGVRIRPLSTVRGFNTVDQDPIAAGRELRVETVLDGSIQLDQQRIRVSARLLRVADGASLWSGKFDQPMGDIFSVQDAIAKQVVDALAVTLSPAAERRMLHPSTSSTTAYQAYVSGLYKWQRRNPAAVEDFETALREDPNYAVAWAGLSSALTAQGVFGYEPPDKVFPRAKDAAMKAVALDGELPDAQSAIGHVLVQYEYRYAEGERYYLASLRLNENDAPTWQRLSLVRGYQGHAKQALADMQRAQQIEPTTLSMNANVGMMLYFTRAYAESKERIESVLALDSHYDYAHSLLGRTLLELGDIDGAIEHFKLRSQPTPGGEGDMGRAYARAGRAADAHAELKRLEQRAREGFGVAYDMATIHAALGETAEACAAIARALTDHSQLVGFISLDPAMDKLRSAPCVQEAQQHLAGG